MFVANHTIVHWGPHGMWLSNFSDDINSTICDYTTKVTWEVTNTMMEHYHDKGLLGWLDCGMALPCPREVPDKRIWPEQWDTWKLVVSTKELGLNISQGPVVVIVIISFVIINHISYKLVIPFLLL